MNPAISTGEKEWGECFSFKIISTVAEKEIEEKKQLVEYHLQYLVGLVAPSMVMPAINFDTNTLRKDSMGCYDCGNHTIYINLRYNNTVIIETLSHEFKHAMQFMENPNRFTTSALVLNAASSIFKNAAFLDFYFKHPIEVAARIFSSKYCLYVKGLMSRETFLALL
jgi:hypothetical protein